MNKIALLAALMMASLITSTAITFTGEIVGTWDVAPRPESGITAGDIFTWTYSYESETIDGRYITFESAPVVSVIKEPFAGTANWSDELLPSGGVEVRNGQIVDYSFPFDFTDVISGEIIRFRAIEGRFSGWGEGSVSVSNPTVAPTSVPEQTNMLCSLSLACAALGLFRKFAITG
jgi:hypothetical protein